MVNQRVIQKVSAKNTGARPQYVRVKVKKSGLIIKKQLQKEKDRSLIRIILE